MGDAIISTVVLAGCKSASANVAVHLEFQLQANRVLRPANEAVIGVGIQRAQG